MTSENQAESLRDVAAGLLTPFDQKDMKEIRYEELAGTASWLYEQGIRLFLSCANISEYHSFTQEERIDSVWVTCETLEDGATVLGGAGEAPKPQSHSHRPMRLYLLNIGNVSRRVIHANGVTTSVAVADLTCRPNLL